MAKQDISVIRNENQNLILDIEKKYFNEIKRIITTESFMNDLLLIEKEVRENYDKYAKTWKLKNKIKIPAERLIRHHVYKEMLNQLVGIYPSPISSDLGLLLEDCVLCVDVKTVDTKGNPVDISSTQVEPNQISFKNSKHKYFKAISNLEAYDHYSSKPVLTYVVKIIYTDNDIRFCLSRGPKPSLVLACIPNGELSPLFCCDIVKNFKTYEYYTAADGENYSPIEVPRTITSKEERLSFFCNKCEEKGFAKNTLPGGKIVYYDIEHDCRWWLVSSNKKHSIMAVKNGSTMRLYNDMLKERYDSKNEPWFGYEEFPIPDPLA